MLAFADFRRKMRVISGKARRISLKTIDGLDTRPTTDRIKETLFNMINNDLYDCTFLDLFSGSGAIGIEALSRGASKCVFIENNRKAIECIKTNLKNTRLEEDAIVISSRVEDALGRLDKTGQVFDFVFMDPPYNKLLEKNVLIFLSKSDLINQNSLIIVEASLDTNFDYIEELGYQIIKEKIYKTNKHLFIKKLEK